MPKVLRIFGRYQHFGGEERVVQQIHEALAGSMEAIRFTGSSETLLGHDVLQRLTAPLRVLHNTHAAREVRNLHLAHHFDAWEIHNVFPALSASIYEEAIRLEVPIIHYLHNYRLSCVNGMFLNHGKLCHRCISGNFFPAFQTCCWRSSRIACGIGGAALHRVRRSGIFEKAVAWIALSEAQKQWCARIGIPGDRIHVIPHFLDAQVINPGPLPEDGYFLYLGRLSEEKGLRFLLEAWRQIEDPNARLVIAGTGPEEHFLRRHASDLNLRGVDFRGFVSPDQQGLLWGGAKALIVPSIWDEPFGLVVLEAWAHGRPALVSNRGALPEIVADSSSVFSAEDPDGLAAKIRWLGGDSAAAQRLASAGKNRLRDFYSREQWLSKVKSVYAGAGIPLHESR
jgi:glycosyltransferase involved in cell wall biosynthesis